MGYYIKNNPDVANAYGMILMEFINHFLVNGMKREELEARILI